MTDDVKKDADSNTSADYYHKTSIDHVQRLFHNFAMKTSLVFMANICGKISKMHLINEIKDKEKKVRRKER